MTNEIFKRKLREKGYSMRYNDNMKQWIIQGNEEIYFIDRGNLQSMTYFLTIR